MIRAATAARANDMLLLGVTVLTSATEQTLREIGITDAVEDQVLRLAKLGAEAGIDGVVASPREIKTLRREFGDRIKIAVQGIRPSWAEPGDQKRFMHIGRLVMVQGSSAFGKDLPPFVVAAERNSIFGLNIVGMRRSGLGASDRDEIKEAFKLVYLSGLNTSQALEKAETMTFGAPAREFLDFVASAKKRGICPLRRGAGDDVSV